MMKKSMIEQALIVAFLLCALQTAPLTHALTVEHGFNVADHGVWTKMNPGANPPNRTDTYFAYDSESDVSILFGGCIARDLLESPPEGYHDRALDDTWAYDFNTDTWKEMSPSNAPGPRGTSPLAYDSESDRIVLFSGIMTIEYPMSHVNWEETWTYDYNSNNWTNMYPVSMPPPRGFSSMAYDSESDVTVLFGGVLDGGPPTSDTWSYDLDNNNWTNMNPSPHPSSRFVSAMCYDSESDKVILFGGGQGGSNPQSFLDTWAYDFNTNTWTNLNPNPHPLSSPGNMAYDVEDDLCIFFGGSTDIDDMVPCSETWAYDYNSNTWFNLSVSSNAVASIRSYFSYDMESDRLIMYGGYGPGRYDEIYNDTWAFDFLGFPTTSTTTPESTTPDGLDPTIALAGVVVAVIVTTTYVFFSRRR